MRHLLRTSTFTPSSRWYARVRALLVLLLAGTVAGLPAHAVGSEPVLQWSAGGLSAGLDSAGQAARMAVDAWGNVAIVSGPANGRDLAVTSYTVNGMRRWQSTLPPASTGTFQGDWVVAAPNGDFLAVGHTLNSSGNPIQISLARFDTNGALLWRVEPSVGFYPSVGRLVVDLDGNAYLAASGRGTGMFVQKYRPDGTLAWSRLDTSGGGYAFAASLTLSPDASEVAVTGSIQGGATWLTALYDAVTGTRKWQVLAAEGTGARDLVMDTGRVYVTGQGATSSPNQLPKYYLSVVAYNRSNGARLWRTDRNPADGSHSFGLWLARAPNGSLVATGQTSRGFLDWYTVAYRTDGSVIWEAVRDGGLNTDEIPRVLRVLADGTTVVSGRGGPNLAGGYWPGKTVGYSSSGIPLWTATSLLETVWVDALPNGNVCATGGYDALINCWVVPGNPPSAGDPPPTSDPTPTLPTAPTKLNASSTVRQRVDLSWANTATNASAVRVERCKGNGCTGFSSVAQLGGTTTAWSDTAVKSKNTYSYRVRTENSLGSSSYSNVASVTAR